jgi:hypothetical protein
MNNYTSIFNVGFLDDLHNYFPDLLYNSDRFRSVQEVLRYIQRVARTQFNPFEQGLRQYNRDNRDNRDIRSNYVVQNNPPTPIPVVDSIRVTRDNTSSNVHMRTDIPYTSSNVHILRTDISGTPQSSVPVTPLRSNLEQVTMPPVRRSRPIYWDLISNNYENNPIDTSMLTTLFTMALNPSFTDVPVVPTNQQIDAATTIGSSTATEPCAICQDGMDPPQPIRRINRCNHTFHRHCIDTWFASGVTCPICRIDIRD